MLGALIIIFCRRCSTQRTLLITKKKRINDKYFLGIIFFFFALECKIFIFAWYSKNYFCGFRCEAKLEWWWWWFCAPERQREERGECWAAAARAKSDGEREREGLLLTEQRLAAAEHTHCASSCPSSLNLLSAERCVVCVLYIMPLVRVTDVEPTSTSTYTYYTYSLLRCCCCCCCFLFFFFSRYIREIQKGALSLSFYTNILTTILSSASSSLTQG